MHVKWNRPEFPNAPLLNYTLIYRPTDQDDVNATVINIVLAANNESISYVMHDLFPYTSYSIKVSAISKAGEGPLTEEQKEQTKIGGMYVV